MLRSAFISCISHLDVIEIPVPGFVVHEISDVEFLFDMISMVVLVVLVLEASSSGYDKLDLRYDAFMTNLDPVLDQHISHTS
jgi:hypothetical protein